MFKKRYKTLIYIILILLLLADTGYSFWQHQAKALDGDMAWNAIPDKDVLPVLSNPFGLPAILEGETYVNPNKFFCHWFNQFYILKAPLYLQTWFSPIESVYVAMGIARTLIQIFLTVLIAIFITKSIQFWTFKGVSAMFLIVCLFQTNGFYRQMAIIDESTTYVFFYALPFVFFLLYILPFVRIVYWNKAQKTSWWIKLLWIPLALVVCLSGPLNPGIALVFSALVFFHIWVKLYKNQFRTSRNYNPFGVFKRIPGPYYFYLSPLILFSFYSLYLGSFNSLSIQSEIPLQDLYFKILEGIHPIFFGSEAYVFIFLLIFINLIFIGNKKSHLYHKEIYRLATWVFIFCFLYIALLPLGGYRAYRPFVIRNDTLLPIIVSFVFLYGITTLHLINKLRKFKLVYLILIGGFIFFYTKMDNENFDKNECEKFSLQLMAESESNSIVLNDNCAPLGWFLSRYPEDSKLQAKLIKHWNITTREVLYCNSYNNN